MMMLSSHAINHAMATTKIETTRVDTEVGILGHKPISSRNMRKVARFLYFQILDTMLLVELQFQNRMQTWAFGIKSRKSNTKSWRI